MRFRPVAGLDDGVCFRPVAGLDDVLCVSDRPVAGLDYGVCFRPVAGLDDGVCFRPVAGLDDVLCVADQYRQHGVHPVRDLAEGGVPPGENRLSEPRQHEAPESHLLPAAYQGTVCGTVIVCEIFPCIAFKSDIVLCL